MDTVCQAFSKGVSLSGLIKPNILLVLSQANLLLMLAIVCSVLCNIQVNEKSCRLRMGAYRDGVKRKGDKIGMGV